MNVTRPNLVFLLQLPENTRWILCKPCVLVCVCMSMCACMCVSVYTWACTVCVRRFMGEAVCMCVFVCVCMCEQVVGIFEDDSRGLTHARPNKTALWWNLRDTLSLECWGLSFTHVHKAHIQIFTRICRCSFVEPPSGSECSTLISAATSGACVWSNGDTRYAQC